MIYIFELLNYQKNTKNYVAETRLLHGMVFEDV